MKITTVFLLATSFVYADDKDVAILESMIVEPPVTLETTLPPPLTPLPKNQFISVGLSYLLPGLGHFYLGEKETGALIFSSSLLSSGVLATGLYSHSEDIFSLGLHSLEASYLYGIYAALRDTRSYNQRLGICYSYPMPKDSFSDLARAPFQPSVLKKLEVWGGLLCSLGSAFAILATVYGSDDAEMKMTSLSFDPKILRPISAFPVGIGEEALFRGLVQSILSERIGPFGGIALTSLAFGAAHIGNAKALPKDQRKNYYCFSLPFIALSGAYYGWLTHKNHSLKESVAVHSWYDFTIFALQAFAVESSIEEKRQLSVSFSF